MAIDAQLHPEVNIVGLPMFGLPTPLSAHHQDYNGGCGFNYGLPNPVYTRKRQRLDEEQQLMYTQHRLQSQQQQQQQMGYQSSCSVSGVQDGAEEIGRKSHNFPVGLDRQSHEIDQYLILQGERLKLFLKEQRQKQEATLLREIGTRAQSLIQQRDQELARASVRTAELQGLLAKLEAEKQAWQRAAREREATVASLNSTLEQLRDRAAAVAAVEEDMESRCDESGAPEAAAAGVEVEEEEEGRKRMKMKMRCKGCNHGETCVLFLPCRHLCSCKSCDVLLERCPLCGAAKKASIEALIP